VRCRAPIKLRYENIFEAITDGPEEAADMQFRADLILVLRDFFRERAATQAQIGQMLRIPQPRVSELMTGKVDKFSADKLIGFLANVGIRFKPSLIPSTRGRSLRVKCDVVVSQSA
jgi:predicted XRE-type DNA-binding protein